MVNNTIATISVDFVVRTFQLSDGSVINCFIYDTAGQEKYNSICESYYRKADAVLLVYDISNKISFIKIKEYYCPKIKLLCKKNIPVLLLGNKADKEDERQVSINEGNELAVSKKFMFKETSCKRNENVSNAFEALIEMWNNKNKKKLFIQKNRRPVLNYNKKSSQSIYEQGKKKNLTSRYNSVILDDDILDDDKTFKIQKSVKTKKEKKKCHC